MSNFILFLKTLGWYYLFHFSLSPFFPTWAEFAVVCLVGLVFMAFGPSYSYSLIRLLYGRKWSDGEASTALRYYCLYIIFLAMNGE